MATSKPSIHTIVVPQVLAPESCNLPQNVSRQKYLEGDPKALGIVQILVGLVEISVGIPLSLSTLSLSAEFLAMYIVGVSCIVSGILSICAEKNSDIKMLRACLSVSIATAALSVFGGILLGLDIATTQFCLPSSGPCYKTNSFHVTCYYTHVGLLLFTILEFIVALVISVFVGKSLQCCHPYTRLPGSILMSFNPDD